MDNKVIILDEPTIAQDYRGKETIKAVIRKLKEEGKTVITIIHDMDFVADTFERAIVFAKGNILLDNNTREVFTNESILKEAYLEQPSVTRLCQSLGYDEVFLNTDEFSDFLMKHKKL
jgi:energy-coupling factor transport system ATP-binding protein